MLEVISQYSNNNKPQKQETSTELIPRKIAAKLALS